LDRLPVNALPDVNHGWPGPQAGEVGAPQTKVCSENRKRTRCPGQHSLEPQAFPTASWRGLNRLSARLVALAPPAAARPFSPATFHAAFGRGLSLQLGLRELWAEEGYDCHMSGKQANCSQQTCFQCPAALVSTIPQGPRADHPFTCSHFEVANMELRRIERERIGRVSR